jgi:molybdopterin-containing oxidoreductase family iron-sulfur binding subunit
MKNSVPQSAIDDPLPQTRPVADPSFTRSIQHLADPVSRRQFFQLMGASLALAGLGACTNRPAETIVPYVRPPEELVPGKPLFFATAMTAGGFATGVLVENHMGRPTKIEGNPSHPASLGATDAFAQASILTLYDPDRAQAPTYRGDIRPWSAFLQDLQEVRAAQRPAQGAGLRILTETVIGPTLAHQLRSILTEFPAAKWHQYEPAGRFHLREGARLAFGEYVNPIYQFDQADVVLALDADPLMSCFGNVRHARDFAGKRRISAARPVMSRLYVVENTPSATGAIADHRVPLRADEIERFARVLAARLGVPGVASAESAVQGQWIEALVQDLQQHRGTSLLVAGEQQSPLVHALVHAMNDRLGNVGTTVRYTAPVEARPVDEIASLRELVEDMAAGKVDTLIILSGNPVYTVPADLEFAARLQNVRLRVHLSLYFDETSELCHWHIPEAHYLESWSDTRAYDGTVSLIQPLIAPLYAGKSAHELLTVLTDQPQRAGYDILRAYWQNQHATGSIPGTAGKDFEYFWRTSLHDGLIAGTALPLISPSLKEARNWGLETGTQNTGQSHASSPQPALEVVFRPDPTVYDGRFANNGWLQELPKPLTKLTWDNAALMSPATATRLGLSYNIGTAGDVAHADVIELQYRGRTVRAPVWIVAGHADDAVTVSFGYGRTRAGRVGTGVGFNAYALRTSDALWYGAGLTIRKTGERYPLACTQLHHTLAGRNIVRAATLEQYLQNPHFANDGHAAAGESHPSLYPEYPYPKYAWGMAIDMTACVGCNACVIACQAENNIPIVGKAEVARGHELHWLRIDTYAAGEGADLQTYYQPMLCVHCEQAPCEVVCPVAATVHSAEGLNDMVYNRCVGTRYCSNNCPYKVRRFNFLQYADWDSPQLKLLRNPEVTTRSRGVMEKCTYCVQRINRARIEAEKEGRSIRDGEVVTACQAACPAEAIVFGNINDPESRVSQLKAEPRNYGVLAELNTRPRTTHLAVVRNPNLKIEKL